VEEKNGGVVSCKLVLVGCENKHQLCFGSQRLWVTQATTPSHH